MARVRLEFHHDGFDEVRRSPEVAADIARRTEAIAAAAGDGFEARTSLTKSRARGVVITAEPAAMVQQARDHTLERSIDAGRG
jgi:hypothetical protein